MVVVAGGYDEAVRVMADEAAARGWMVISDTSWPGYDEIPRLIMLGYTRLMDEAESSRSSRGRRPTSSSFPAASADFWRPSPAGPTGATAPAARGRGVEPATAACLQLSVQQRTANDPPGTVRHGDGRITLRRDVAGRVPVRHARWSTPMSAIEDEVAFDAMRLLATPAARTLPVRAARRARRRWAGCSPLSTDPALQAVTERLGLGPNSSFRCS